MASALDTALSIVKDPALPALVNRMTLLRDMEVADATAATGQPPAPDTTPGIGLHRAVRALDGYLWFRRNRWIAAVAVGGLILIPGLVGFAAGRLSAQPAKPSLTGAPPSSRSQGRRSRRRRG